LALLCAILAACLSAVAQSSGRAYRIGWFESAQVRPETQKAMLDELSRLAFLSPSARAIAMRWIFARHALKACTSPNRSFCGRIASSP
jgi:hypothetical protein